MHTWFRSQMVSLDVATGNWQMQYYNDLLCHCGKSVKCLNTPVGERMLDTKPVVAISTIA